MYINTTVSSKPPNPKHKYDIQILQQFNNQTQVANTPPSICKMQVKVAQNERNFDNGY
eukprot:m.237387 g.237387  ORF g.237387 m.237387 type:complete len:58 (-) comp33707_c1_seq6:148-321(-)